MAEDEDEDGEDDEGEDETFRRPTTLTTSTDGRRNSSPGRRELSNGGVETFWDALGLGIQPFLRFGLNKSAF